MVRLIRPLRLTRMVGDGILHSGSGATGSSAESFWTIKPWLIWG